MCFVPVFRGCVWYVCCVLAITEMMFMALYEVLLSMSLLGFGMGTMLGKFHMCGIML